MLTTTDRGPAIISRNHPVPRDLRCVMPDKSTVVTCTACGRRNRIPASATGTPRCGQCRAPLPWLTEAGSDDFDEVVMAADIPVLVDLWAPWCGPCRMVSPLLEDLAREEAGRIKLVKVNVDEAPDIADRFDVRGIPTLLVIRDGEIAARQTGAPPAPALRSWLTGALDGVPRRAATQ
jgi:thioredoxin 2